MRFFDCLGAAVMVSGLVFTGGGCFVHDNTTSTSSNGSGKPPPPTEVSVSVDKGGALTTDPGSGVAILVEYEGATPGDAASSRWNIQTTCDTLKSNYACSFDLYARSNSIRLANTISTEGGDFVDQQSGQLHAGLNTSADIDGFTFDVPQGQDVEVETYLDGQPAASYVFFVGSGVTHAGVATNPALFIPGS